MENDRDRNSQNTFYHDRLNNYFESGPEDIPCLMS